MFTKLKLAAAAIAASVTLIPAAAPAQYYDYGRGGYYGGGYDRGYGRDQRDWRRDQRRAYRQHNRGYRQHYNRGRYRCDRGDGGTILGAVAGGLLGNAAVGRYGDRTAGTIVGAGVGALAGRAIDRNC